MGTSSRYGYPTDTSATIPRASVVSRHGLAHSAPVNEGKEWVYGKQQEADCNPYPIHQVPAQTARQMTAAGQMAPQLPTARTWPKTGWCRGTAAMAA